MLGKTSVFLIGPMGSGKTAVGRHLSRALGLPFYDSDGEIERRTGVDIPFIFEKEGEAGFRQREREAIEALTLLARIVLATGGGAVLLPENRRHLAERGCVVYLQTSVAQQAQRVRHGRNRPLLSDGDTSARLGQLDRKSTRLNSSHLVISYAVFCLKKKNNSHDVSDSSTNIKLMFVMIVIDAYI